MAVIETRYKWENELIGYCSDPFNKFPDHERTDRAYAVLIGILKYTNNGKLEKKDFIEYLLNKIKNDNDNLSDNSLSDIRSTIDDIIGDFITPKY